MNILELIAKNDPNVQLQVWNDAKDSWQPHPNAKSCISAIRRLTLMRRALLPKIGMSTVWGLVLRPGMRVLVRRASRYWPDYAGGHGSFQLCKTNFASVRASLAWRAGEEQPQTNVTEWSGGKLEKVAVQPAPTIDMDLVITVPPRQWPAKLFLGVHRLLDRNDLYKHCKGRGVEIGPGPRPQILPGAHIQVQYVEQATPDQWQQLYGKDTKTPVDPGLWKLYVVGNADQIPAEQNSLDFIFSSHVIEHLANPLGHLAYWSKLLKKGGVVAAVIPDMRGCKDYVFQPSTLEELDAEYRRGLMTPTLDHYRRWCNVRAPKTDPAEVLARGRSIHVHFYTPETMQTVLQARYRELGYRTCTVTSSPNHKDFFVLLAK
ncbi:methyltransferase domain-containing protein [Hylemonella sp. W303a]|uniref:methyltransferase domain-containing protein n=1 Tax=Hylemonella sp. W303a TaxID=3389873 RepID=UPI00396B1021